jgi:hypothetical protein
MIFMTLLFQETHGGISSSPFQAAFIACRWHVKLPSHAFEQARLSHVIGVCVTNDFCKNKSR